MAAIAPLSGTRSAPAAYARALTFAARLTFTLVDRIHDVGVPARHLGVSAGDLRALAGDIGGLVDSRPGASLGVDCTRLSTAASVTVTGDELDQRVVGLDRGRRRS
jgi:hypothetical protein